MYHKEKYKYLITGEVEDIKKIDIESNKAIIRIPKEFCFKKSINFLAPSSLYVTIF